MTWSPARCAPPSSAHKLRNLERKAPKHALAAIRDDFHRIVYAASAEAARSAYTTFERTWKRCPGVVTSLREGGGTPHVLPLPQGPVEDPAHDERDRATARRVPPARQDARLAAGRRR